MRRQPRRRDEDKRAVGPFRLGERDPLELRPCPPDGIFAVVVRDISRAYFNASMEDGAEPTYVMLPSIPSTPKVDVDFC